MSNLHQMLADYLAIRRALGFKLAKYGTLLPDFIASLDDAGCPVITTALALAWATKPTDASRRCSAERLDIVRQFARYVHTLDPRMEIPAYDLLTRPKGRRPPYIYADGEVVALMGAADRIARPFRALTFRTLIGLLASTGMRIGEVLALDQTDLDAEQHMVTVCNGKLGRSRQVPLHTTPYETLEDYTHSRNRLFRRSTDPSLLVSLAGTRLIYSNVQFTFSRLVAWTGLADRKPRRPRIHDLRHTFAVRTLIHWYQAGVDVEPRLPLLSAYLGHVGPSTTYWYLSAVPELVGLAGQRLERSLRVRS